MTAHHDPHHHPLPHCGERPAIGADRCHGCWKRVGRMAIQRATPACALSAKSGGSPATHPRRRRPPREARRLPRCPTRA